MKIYRDEEGFLSYENNSTEPLMTVRSKTMSGCINMLEMLQLMENRENKNLEDYV